MGEVEDGGLVLSSAGPVVWIYDREGSRFSWGEIFRIWGDNPPEFIGATRHRKVARVFERSGGRCGCECDGLGRSRWWMDRDASRAIAGRLRWIFSGG